MLEFKNVCFQYDSEDFSIIDHLSFSVRHGEFVSVIGASGCGKSTIFRLANQLLHPDSGEILADGKSITGLKSYCGYMPQHDLLFPWRTVKENVKLPMEIAGGYTKAEMNEKADRALESVGLSGWADRPRESCRAECARGRPLPERCLPDRIFFFWTSPFPRWTILRGFPCGSGF